MNTKYIADLKLIEDIIYIAVNTFIGIHECLVLQLSAQKSQGLFLQYFQSYSPFTLKTSEKLLGSSGHKQFQIRTFSVKSIETTIACRRCRWIGHILRKDQGSIAKVSVEWKPEGHRKRGRPRM